LVLQRAFFFISCGARLSQKILSVNNFPIEILEGNDNMLFMKPLWTKEELENLRIDYPKMDNSREYLCQKYSATWTQLNRKAVSMNLHRERLYPHTVVLTRLEIINLYLDGYNRNDIAKFCKCCRSVIERILKQEKVIARTRSQVLRKYKVNETYFDNIDSEEKAYILGLLYADGCNYSKKGVIELSLQEADKNILLKIQKLLFLNCGNLYMLNGNEKHQNQYKIMLNSPYMSRRLTELGCMPNKTFKLTFPDWLQPELYRHFIRGYFDGDGCISITPVKDKPKQYNHVFNVVGTKHVINRIQDILIKELYLGKVKIHKPKNIYYLTYSGRINCLKIKNYLYKDATIFLQRKYDKFNTFSSSFIHGNKL
jgi:intein-encoded DNA endonuclease-like protein